jgi:hypothetical protein
MTIVTKWVDETQSIICHAYQVGWTLADFHAVVDLTYSMTMSVDQCVDTISDFTNSKTSPGQLISASRHIEQKLPPYPHISVVVNPPTFVQVIVDVMTRLGRTADKNPVTVRFARSLDEAYTIIQDYRAKVVRQVRS